MRLWTHFWHSTKRTRWVRTAHWDPQQKHRLKHSEQEKCLMWNQDGTSEQFNMARAQASEERPAIIIASFPCPLETNYGASAQRSLEDQTYLERVITMHEDQLDRGGWNIHEHPWNAESWEHPRIEGLRSRPDMHIVRGPMCHWRQDVQDRPGFASEKSEACWMTNSRITAHTLSHQFSSTIKQSRTRRGVAQIFTRPGSKTECKFNDRSSNAFGARDSESPQTKVDGGRRSRKSGTWTVSAWSFDSTSRIGRCRRAGSLLGWRWRRMAGPSSGTKGKAERSERVPQVRSHWHRATQAVRRAQATRSADRPEDQAHWHQVVRHEQGHWSWNRNAQQTVCKGDQKIAGDCRCGDRWQRLWPFRQYATDRSDPHDLLTAYEPTFVQHGEEPESETVRHQKSILQRASSTRASVHRSPLRIDPGGHGPLDSDRHFAWVNVRTRDAGTNWEMEITSCLMEAAWVQGVACPCPHSHWEMKTGWTSSEMSSRKDTRWRSEQLSGSNGKTTDLQHSWTGRWVWPRTHWSSEQIPDTRLKSSARWSRQ